MRTDEDDPRLAAAWHRPSGGRTTCTTGFAPAAEMPAWSRWQLGWLDDSQIRCVNESSANVALSPVAEPGDSTAMAAPDRSATLALPERSDS